MDSELFRVLLDNLRTNTKNRPRPRSIRIYGQLTGGQTADIAAVLRTAKDATIVQDGALTDSTRYDVIVDLNSTIENIQARAPLYAKHLAEKGLLVVSTPNGKGLQRLGYHQASLKITQIDSLLCSYVELSPIFREFIGKFLLLNSHPAGPLPRLTRKLGRYLPSSGWYSPQMLFIYSQGPATKPYVSELSLGRRIRRVQARTVYRIRNHRVNDYIVASQRQWQESSRTIQNLLFITRYRFSRDKLAKIEAWPRNPAKTRVAIAMTWLEMGGVERVMLNILKDMDRSRYEIILITTIASRNPWHDKFEELVDKVVHVPAILGDDCPESYKVRYVRQLLVKQSIEALLITNSATAYRALRGLHRKLPGVRAYDLLHTHGTPADNDAYLRISMPYDRFITRRIVIDEYLRQYYCQHYPVDPERILVIYNGIDKESLRKKPDPAAGATIIRKQASERAIVYLGRLESDKSPMRLVHIAHGLQQTLTKDMAGRTYVAVCGDGILRHDMEQKARKLGIMDKQIRFVGYVDNTLDAVAAGEFSILTSDSEGIPMSVLESMHARTPSISPAVGGLPEMVDDHVDGYLVPIRSLSSESAKIAAFVSACTEALALSPEAYDAMSATAHKKVADKFGHMSEIYMALFDGELDDAYGSATQPNNLYSERDD